jgi:predicted  nucleic acid-binding Zn-ribbon protein
LNRRITVDDLIDRLRSEAEISDRPGQYDRLNELADEFAATLEAARAERDALREALKGLITTWIPSADTYRRLGFDAEAPRRALKEARAVLRRKGWK